MANATILDLNALLTASPPASCSLEIVNPTVTTDAPAGSSQRMTVTQLFTSPTIASPTITGTAVISAATFSGTVGFNGNITVNVATPKFTIAEATGNTAIVGTLTNTGLITGNGGVTVAGAGLTLSNVNLLPATDNTCTLGSASFRLSDLRTVLATFSGAVSMGGAVTMTAGLTVNTAYSFKGSVSAPTATATTLFAATNAGLYHVFVTYAGAPAPSTYTAQSDGTAAIVTALHVGSVTVTASTLNIQGNQASGSTQTLNFTYLFMSA